MFEYGSEILAACGGQRQLAFEHLGRWQPQLHRRPARRGKGGERLGRRRIERAESPSRRRGRPDAAPDRRRRPPPQRAADRGSRAPNSGSMVWQKASTSRAQVVATRSCALASAGTPRRWSFSRRACGAITRVPSRMPRATRARDLFSSLPPASRGCSESSGADSDADMVNPSSAALRRRWSSRERPY